MPYALEIPELRFHLAQYLNRPSLVHCALVSRDWNATFQDWIYREINTVNEDIHHKIHLPRSTLDRHLHAVRKLDLDWKDSKVLASSSPSLTCPNLKSLNLKLNIFTTRDSLILIHNHRHTITTLSLRGFPLPGFTDIHESLWQAAASCSFLEMLCMYRIELTPKVWPCFWSLWSRLTGLRLTSVGLFTPPETSQRYDSHQHPDGYNSFLRGRCPSRIKTLEMSNVSGLPSFEDDLRFLSYCPVVETFLWTPIFYKRGRELPYMSLGKELVERTRSCSNLTRLKLNIDSKEQQDCLKLFLDSRLRDDTEIIDDDSGESSERIKNTLLPRSLESLTLYGTILFDRACCQLLERQAGSTLRTLKLTLDIEIDGRMLHRIFCSLPALESFTASSWFRAADDFSEFPDHPWVCKGMSKLQISAPLPSREEYQEEVYRRVGVTFKKLRALRYFGGRIDWTRVRRHLGGLHSLEILESYNGTMTEDDVRWMIEHWTGLECVLGSLHPEHEVDETLWKILREHGIRRNLVTGVVQID